MLVLEFALKVNFLFMILFIAIYCVSTQLVVWLEAVVKL